MAYEYITNQDSPNFTAAKDAKSVFGYDRVIEGITIHHWGDPNLHPQFQSVADYLCRNGGNSSAHFVCEAGKVSCIVSPSDVAWHSGSAWGNARTIGIELNPRASDADYDTAAELVADIRSAYGDVPIYWHSYFAATACPGRWSAERLDALSYTKFSADQWGKGYTKPEFVPKPADVVIPQPVPTPTPAPTPAQQVPSPTTNGSDGEPLIDSGKPVAEKIDYPKENNTLLKWIVALLKKIFNVQ